jgi:hypothetical protein
VRDGTARHRGGYGSARDAAEDGKRRRGGKDFLFPKAGPVDTGAGMRSWGEKKISFLAETLFKLQFFGTS